MRGIIRNSGIEDHIKLLQGGVVGLPSLAPVIEEGTYEDFRQCVLDVCKVLDFEAFVIELRNFFLANRYSITKESLTTHAPGAATVEIGWQEAGFRPSGRYKLTSIHYGCSLHATLDRVSQLDSALGLFSRRYGMGYNILQFHLEDPTCGYCDVEVEITWLLPR